MTVGRTWRFTSGPSAASTHDRSGYRNRINQLRQAAPDVDFGLPWPEYRSWFWTYMLNGDYRRSRSHNLVAALLPLTRRGSLPGTPETCFEIGYEALLHPFALTTLVHLQLTDTTSWSNPGEAYERLHATLCGPLVAGGQVRDGLPRAWLTNLPATDLSGDPLDFREAGRFTLVSGLHQAVADPDALAAHLTPLFDGTTARRTERLRTDRSALSATGDNIGFVLPHDLPRAGQRARCLHQNYATMLGYVQNLATLTQTAAVAAGQWWFQQRAAIILNHLCRREKLPETGSIYQSRLPELWIRHRGITGAIDRLTPPSVPALA
ncbi:hypothetical protein GCM10010492_58510 [Saccharothrix mutabilis subsp. mutabilis]|uniref:Uncharacterized protein n=1 Tax=Saccharothrix mutabilis subsp. mutabilis TaxID=66855 RepID=A0ABP3E2J7_9PSEU